MKSLTFAAAAVLAASVAAGSAEAFTSKSAKTVTVGTSTVAESTTFDVTIVNQTTGAAASLAFEGTTNVFRDSGESLQVTVNTNLAANRIITYTNNLDSSAVPFKFCEDTAKGIDGGGLVGQTDCAQTVPIVWGLMDAVGDYVFTPVALPGVGATNGVFITDRAHVATFTTKNSALDNNTTMKFCSGGAAVPNTAGDGLYPQFFGNPGVTSKDICQADGTTKIADAQELSKNIAVVGFDFLGTAGLGPNTTTVASDDTITLTSPFFMPMGADFRKATAQTYGTNTLTVELVTQ